MTRGGSRRILVALLAIAGSTCISVVADEATTEEGITFTKQIAPILQKNCQDCHRPGEVAPMSLLTYEESRPWAKAIKKQVAAKTMPPWHADPRYGKFSNDMSLTDAEIEVISRWVDLGAPEGNHADLPPPKVWESKEWELGEPDYFFKPDKPFMVPPTQKNADLYQCIVIPTNLTEDTWVSGFEYKIDNRRIVHHIVGFMDTSRKAAESDAATPEPGFPCSMGGAGGNGPLSTLDSMLGGWGPGVPANLNHPGTAKLLKKESSIVLQMHYYNQTGKEQPDQSGLAIHLARGTVRAQSRIAILFVSPYSFKIPAGNPNAEQRAFWSAPKDIMIYSIAPHMHNLGKSMTISAIHPDGNKEILLSVPRYDFNWQRTYRLVEPRALAKGTKLEMISVHDNSTENPRNPNAPPIDVKWGESTTEEMSLGFIGYWFAEENLGAPGS